MQGLGASITPTGTGRLLITVSGYCSPLGGISYQISFGTGTAPSNGAALAGAQVGLIQTYDNTGSTVQPNWRTPFSVSALIQGLTLSTTYWIDLAAISISVIAVNLKNVNVIALEC